MVRSLVPWGLRTPCLLHGFHPETSRLLGRFFGPESGEADSDIFAPRVNLAENEKEYEITLDLPGMKPEEVDVEFKEGQLWVTGERKHENEEKGKTYHRVERRYGRFRRVISLEDVKADGILAEYKDGVLRITVPKDEASLPRRIEVKS